MIQVNIADAEANFSHYLKLAVSGERVVIFERDKPVVELTPINQNVDMERRLSAFGLFENSGIPPEVIDGALRPMTDGEVDAFLEGRY